MKFKLIAIALSAAAVTLAVSEVVHHQPANEVISFNDGSASTCKVIEITANATREDIADALDEGARIVANEHPCVNYHIEQ